MVKPYTGFPKKLVVRRIYPVIFPPLTCLQELIENPQIPKLGVNIAGESMFTS